MKRDTLYKMIAIFMGIVLLGGGLWFFGVGAEQRSGVPAEPLETGMDREDDGPSEDKCSLFGNKQEFTYNIYDYARTGTAVGGSASATLYDVDSNGVLTPAGPSVANGTTINTNPFQDYTLHVTMSGYFDSYVDFRTNCENPYVPDRVLLPAIDGSVGVKFFDQRNGTVANANTSNELNFATKGETRNVEIRLSGGEAYSYITSPYMNRFMLTLNFTDASALSGPLTTMTGCTKTGIPQSLAGSADLAWVCNSQINSETGEMASADWGFETHILHLACASGDNATDGEDIGMYFLPFDYYTGRDGYVYEGVEDDDGTAVATANYTEIFV